VKPPYELDQQPNRTLVPLVVRCRSRSCRVLSRLLPLLGRLPTKMAPTTHYFILAGQTTMAEPDINAEQAALLSALYQAERADTSAIFANALAVLGFAIAYVAVVLGFATSGTKTNGVMLAFAPMRACALIAYHQMMVGMNGARAVSAFRLEKKIDKLLGIPELAVQGDETLSKLNGMVTATRMDGDLTFGIDLGERFLNPVRASRGRALGSIMVYSTLVVGTLAFSILMLVSAAQKNAGVLSVALGALLSGVGFLIALWNLFLNAHRPEIEILSKSG
jgi:hypothetical protein